MIRPVLVVEIGCFIGFSTLHFAQAIREQGFGKMISIDPFDWDVDAGKGMENREVVALRYWQKADILDTLHYVKGYSTDVYDSIKQKINNQIDLLYIDGDHSIKGVFSDFNTYYNDVRVGGYIILHDIYPSMCGEYGPRTLIDRLKAKRLIPGKIELLEMSTKDGFGVAVLRKVSSDNIKIEPSVQSISNSLLQRCWRKLKGRFPFFQDKIVTPDTIICRIKIVDEKTKEPVPDALLVCPQRWHENRVADEKGMVIIDHYIPNRYLWQVEADGYCTKCDVLIDVVAGKTKQDFTICLSPAKE